MTEKMSRWGIGPWLIVITASFAAVVFVIDRALSPMFKIRGVPDLAIWTVSGVLIAAGIVMLALSGRDLNRAYEGDTLCTTGTFAVCRNPIYSAWILFLLPGMALLFGSWLMLTVPAVLYIAFRVLIRKEEVHLEQTFGEAYLDYKRRVYAIFPTLFKKS